MNRVILFTVALLFAQYVLADCGRLTKDDTYRELNAIFDCIENRISESPVLNNAAEFITGSYVDSNGYAYLVSGGGVLGDKRTTWSLRSTTKGRIFNVAWTTGPSLGHPQVGSLDIASKLPNDVSYGVLGGENYSGWRKGGLVAVTQAGDSITVWAYHDDKSGFTNLTHATNSLVLTRVRAKAN